MFMLIAVAITLARMYDKKEVEVNSATMFCKIVAFESEIQHF